MKRVNVESGARVWRTGVNTSASVSSQPLKGKIISNEVLQEGATGSVLRALVQFDGKPKPEWVPICRLELISQ